MILCKQYLKGTVIAWNAKNSKPSVHSKTNMLLQIRTIKQSVNNFKNLRNQYQKWLNSQTTQRYNFTSLILCFKCYFPVVTGKLMMKKFLGISREHSVLQTALRYKIQHKRKKIWPSAYDILNFYSPRRWAPWLNVYHGSSSVKI